MSAYEPRKQPCRVVAEIEREVHHCPRRRPPYGAAIVMGAKEAAE